MRTSRTSLLTLAAVAALATAGSTIAEAGGGFFGSSFCHRGPLASIGRAHVPSSAPRKIAHVKPKNDDDDTRRAHRKRPAAAQVKSADVAGAAVRARVAAASVNRNRPAAEPAKSAAVAGAATSIQSAASAPTCLTKEYLDTGAVRFGDTCTKEWAVNSTDVAVKSSVEHTCLSKDNHQNGIVIFRDTCTNEWAMNTQRQLAQSPRP